MKFSSLFRRFSSRWVLFLCAALLLWNLGYAPFWNPDEGYYASASLEMAHGFNGQAPDWVVPHLNTITRLNKPPLVYWLGATFYKFFGDHEWAGRLSSALFAVAILLMLWQIARRVWNERVGIFAAMIWATSLLSFGMARFMNTDMLLCGALTLALFGLWRAFEYSKCADGTIRFEGRAFLIAGAGMGLALLAKGPVGMLFPLAISFFYLLAARRWDLLHSGRIWGGVALASALAIAIATPWYLAANARDPDFLRRFVLEENFGRFGGGQDYHNKTPIYYYLPIVILGLFPWTPLLFCAAFDFPRRRETLQDRARIFAWIWAAFIICLFSVSQTKLFSYILPAFPALAILCAAALDRVLDGARNLRKSRFFVPIIVGASNLILLGGCAFGALGGIVVTREVGAPYVVFIAAILGIGTLISCELWRKNSLSRAVFAHFATFALLFAVLLSFAGRAAFFADSSPLVASLKPYLRADEKVVLTMFQPTAIFYSARPITTVGFRNASGLNNTEIESSPLFLVPEGALKIKNPAVLERERMQAVARVLDLPPRVFVIMRRREFASAMRAMQPFLRVPTFVIGRGNDYLILSNRPAPPGYDFQFVAPKAADKERAEAKKEQSEP